LVILISAPGILPLVESVITPCTVACWAQRIPMESQTANAISNTCGLLKENLISLPPSCNAARLASLYRGIITTTGGEWPVSPDVVFLDRLTRIVWRYDRLMEQKISVEPKGLDQSRRTRLSRNTA
jgi:hypothetical protein